jgi:two-component sensor histidine kinase
MLAVVQGLTHTIARRSTDMDEFETRLRGCIQALAASHDLLVAHDWLGATLEELLRTQLAPFGGIDGGRILARGPEIHLRPPAMQSLGLILHELATNAAKHGALSGTAGTTTIRWSAAGEGVDLVWTEAGGPPVAPPERKGFGQTVFERIGASLDGSIEAEYRREGFCCRIAIGNSNLLPADARGDRPHGLFRPSS